MEKRQKIFLLILSISIILILYLSFLIYDYASFCWEKTPEAETYKRQLAVITALSNYYSDYRHLPLAKENELNEILQGNNIKNQNPVEKNYMKIIVSPDKNFSDAWGNKMKIIIDYKSNKVTITAQGKKHIETSCIFSE